MVSFQRAPTSNDQNDNCRVLHIDAIRQLPGTPDEVSAQMRIEGENAAFRYSLDLKNQENQKIQLRIRSRYDVDDVWPGRRLIIADSEYPAETFFRRTAAADNLNEVWLVQTSNYINPVLPSGGAKLKIRGDVASPFPRDMWCSIDDCSEVFVLYRDGAFQKMRFSKAPKNVLKSEKLFESHVYINRSVENDAMSRSRLAVGYQTKVSSKRVIECWFLTDVNPRDLGKKHTSACDSSSALPGSTYLLSEDHYWIDIASNRDRVALLRNDGAAALCMKNDPKQKCIVVTWKTPSPGSIAITTEASDTMPAVAVSTSDGKVKLCIPSSSDVSKVDFRCKEDPVLISKPLLNRSSPTGPLVVVRDPSYKSSNESSIYRTIVADPYGRVRLTLFSRSKDEISNSPSMVVAALGAPVTAMKQIDDETYIGTENGSVTRVPTTYTALRNLACRKYGVTGNIRIQEMGKNGLIEVEKDASKLCPDGKQEIQ